MPTLYLNQEKIGDYLYFFRSPVPGCSHALIGGHSGWVPRLGDRFTIPAGVTLNFRSWHGCPNKTHPTREILNNRPYNCHEENQMNASPKATSMLIDEHEKKTFTAGESCCNYVIVKGVGKHWSKKNSNDSSYAEISRHVYSAANIGKPVHFVSVRNRDFWNANKFQLLSDVINLVKAHDPQITTFVMAGCRELFPDWNPR
ncbi:MAG: hypothetical protein RPU52_12625 [Candidatus Sedimenticola sp. (ex Thyasira tokunagai)]